MATSVFLLLLIFNMVIVKSITSFSVNIIFQSIYLYNSFLIYKYNIWFSSNFYLICFIFNYCDINLSHKNKTLGISKLIIKSLIMKIKTMVFIFIKLIYQILFFSTRISKTILEILIFIDFWVFFIFFDLLFLANLWL